MQKVLKYISFVFLMMISITGFSSDFLSYSGKLEKIPFTILVDKSVIQLNNLEYNSYFSRKYRIPLATIEFLEDFDYQGNDKRNNRFLIDKRIPIDEQANSFDYYKKKYDRGHLAAAANTTYRVSLMESFLYTNIVPQNSDLNRGMWSSIEKFARTKGGYILTGIGFDNCDVYESLNGVAIPDYFWKIIVPENNSIRMFLVPNKKPDKKITEYVSTLDKIQSKLCDISIKFE